MAKILSKSARFRLYVFALSVVYSLAFLFVAFLQSRVASRRLTSLRTDFEARFEQLAAGFSSVSSNVVASVPSGSERLTSDDVPRYIVLGHGRSKRFGYLDIQYVSDGAVDRFIYRPESIYHVVDDIEREVFRHEYGLVSRSSSPASDPYINENQ